jgi:hypothetical protein
VRGGGNENKRGHKSSSTYTHGDRLVQVAHERTFAPTQLADGIQDIGSITVGRAASHLGRQEAVLLTRLPVPGQ